MKESYPARFAKRSATFAGFDTTSRTSALEVSEEERTSQKLERALPGSAPSTTSLQCRGQPHTRSGATRSGSIQTGRRESWTTQAPHPSAEAPSLEQRYYEVYTRTTGARRLRGNANPAVTPAVCRRAATALACSCATGF